MYKAIFIDIDATLTNDLRQISTRTKKAIKETVNSGILVIICSGRDIRSATKISKECFASPYVISSNGAVGYDYKNDKYIFNNPIAKEDCLKLYNIAKKNNTNFLMNVGNERYVLKKTNRETDIILDESLLKNIINTLNVEQCLLQDDNYEKIKSLKNEIEKIENVEIKNQSKSLTNPKIEPGNSTYCDIANIKTSKGFGIEKMCEYLNIDLKNCISIGDDYNDISMFNITGLSVVMGNANNEVKAKAKYQTLTNNQDGVAVFLEKIIKNKGDFIC